LQADEAIKRLEGTINRQLLARLKLIGWLQLTRVVWDQFDWNPFLEAVLAAEMIDGVSKVVEKKGCG